MCETTNCNTMRFPRLLHKEARIISPGGIPMGYGFVGLYKGVDDKTYYVYSDANGNSVAILFYDPFKAAK